MMNLGRLSTGQKYNFYKNNIVQNQVDFSKKSLQVNTGKRYLNNYSQYGGTRDLSIVNSELGALDQTIQNTSIASTELGLAETALNSMKELLDQVKLDALQGSNDTYSPTELKILGEQLRKLGENIYSVSNTKIGNKYIFGGLQSDKKVVDYKSGDLFDNALYKEGLAELGNRQIEGSQSSVSLQDIFNQNSQSAQVQGQAFAVPLAAAAQINLVVHDGESEIIVGDIDFAAGDDLATIVTKINTAFNDAGGSGTIVEDAGGFLAFDTAGVTGNVENSAAMIAVSQGLTSPGSLADLGLNSSTNYGVSKDLRQTLGELDSAYFSGDNQRLRNSLADIEANMDRLISTITEIGNLQKQFDEGTERLSEKQDLKEVEQADIVQIPVAEAMQNLNAAQQVYSLTLQFSTRVMQQSLFDFI